MSVVAVLEVLAFADAVRGDEQVEFAFAGEVFGALLGAGREGRDDAGKSLRRLGSVVWLWPAPVTRAECRPSAF